LKKVGKHKTEGARPKTNSFKNTHDRVLEKALELFSKKGFEGATTREIAAVSGVSEVTLYRHFESKDDIFAQIAKRFSIVPLLKNIPSEVFRKPLKEKLKYIATGFFSIFKERSAMMRIMFSEAVVHKQQAKMIFENIPLKALNMISEMLELEMAAGIIKKSNSRIISRLFLGMLLSYNIMNEMLYGKEYEQFDDNEVIENIVNIYLKGIEKKHKMSCKEKS